MTVKNSATALPAAVLEIWRYAPVQNTSSIVLPDGCSDLIVRTYQHQEAECFVSPLADTAYRVASGIGEHFTGYRFCPGAVINQTRLSSALRTSYFAESMLELLDDCVQIDERIIEALASLSVAASIAAATRSLGVSERSLERLIRSATGRTPSYWKNLARVRRAAAALSQAVPLAALACDYGFADQAHMSRAFKHWFGISPSAFRASPILLTTVSESGY